MHFRGAGRGQKSENESDKGRFGSAPILDLKRKKRGVKSSNTREEKKKKEEPRKTTGEGITLHSPRADGSSTTGNPFYLWH